MIILDSDEFLEEDPRPLLSRCNKQGYNSVLALRAHFYIVNEDIEKPWFKNKCSIDSFGQLPSYYKINNREPRLFKNEKNVKWPAYKDNNTFANIQFPLNGKVCPKMIVIRHYQYRSCEQVENRIRQRSEIYLKTGRFSHHKNLRGLDTYIKDKNKDALDYAKNEKKIKSSYKDILFIEIRIMKKNCLDS
jgi:hypothetical protein